VCISSTGKNYNIIYLKKQQQPLRQYQYPAHDALPRYPTFHPSAPDLIFVIVCIYLTGLQEYRLYEFHWTSDVKIMPTGTLCNAQN
jgi:hypothetical protein